MGYSLLCTRMRTFQVKFILVHETRSTSLVDLVYTLLGRAGSRKTRQIAATERCTNAGTGRNHLLLFRGGGAASTAPSRRCSLGRRLGAGCGRLCSRGRGRLCTESAGAAVSVPAGPGSAGASSSSSPAVESCCTTSTAGDIRNVWLRGTATRRPLAPLRTPL